MAVSSKHGCKHNLMGGMDGLMENMFYILGGYNQFTSPPSDPDIQRIHALGGVFVTRRPAPDYEWMDGSWVQVVQIDEGEE